MIFVSHVRPYSKPVVAEDTYNSSFGDTGFAWSLGGRCRISGSYILSLFVLYYFEIT